MKKLKKLNLNNANELSNNEMKDLFGGISQEEYCYRLKKMMVDNGSYWDVYQWDSAANALNANC